MTPAELAQVKAMIDSSMSTQLDRALNKAIQPIWEKFTAVDQEFKELKNVDRRHSGTHKDLAVDFRKSVTEVREATNDDLMAAQRHFAAELDAFRKEMTAVPARAVGAEAAAVAGARASVDAKNATTDLAIAQVQAAAQAKRTARIHAIGVFVAIVIANVIQFLKG